MKTKEEILQEAAGLGGLAFHAKFQGRNCLSIIEAKSAMESYGKEIAIAFLEYADNNGYTSLVDGLWASYSDPGKTSEELFNQFIQQLESK